MRSDTWGSETSQYPEEKKSTEIPQVVASERGRGQTEGFILRGCGQSFSGGYLGEWPGKANHRG